jgi:hypothetical protein
MIVEPYAGSSARENLNPVGRVYDSFSAFLCVPKALSQPGRYSPGWEELSCTYRIGRGR